MIDSNSEEADFRAKHQKKLPDKYWSHFDLAASLFWFCISFDFYFILLDLDSQVRTTNVKIERRQALEKHWDTP